MRPDLEARIERAVDAAFDADVPNHMVMAVYGEGVGWRWPCQTALKELIRGDVADELAETFAYRLNWESIQFAFAYQNEEDRDRWIDCSGMDMGVEWPRTISREASFAPHSWPGTSPALLREAADDVEQLIHAGLLEPIPANHQRDGFEVYRMPVWLWAAYLEAIQRIAERSIRSKEREDAPPAPAL
jgi:hypothetical protein